MRQNKYSVGLNIWGWGGVRGYGKVLKLLTKVSTTLSQLTVAKICFYEMIVTERRGSQNLFWQMQF